MISACFIGLIVGFVSGSLLTKAEMSRNISSYRDALEKIASGRYDMNKLVGIAIKALEDNK